MTEEHQVPRTRSRRWRRWSLIILGVAVLGTLVFVGGVTAWEYTNSPEFCGTTCHTMPPEYLAYQVSPHARVSCVDCHLGQQSVLSAIPSKAQEIRHVTDALFKSYETPIYIRNLRPARDTCEKCHFPEKFSSDSVREVRRYAPDKANSQTSTWLVMKIGGGTSREGLGKGIHWHIENQVWYISPDPLKQNIPYIKQIDAGGQVTEYFDAAANLPADYGTANSSQLKLMDCIDCHNRISHEFRSPNDIVDDALARRSLDRSIPEIKTRAVELLSAKYADHAAAEQAIEQLDGWYKANYAEYYAANQPQIRQAIDALKFGYETSVFPDMDVAWETHPDNTGHNAFPGCFRCHDGKHTSVKNESIRLECNLCHTIPEVQGPEGKAAPVIALEKPGEPESHLDSNWMARHRTQFDQSCSTCHDVGNPGGSDDSSFCSNSACHAREWKYVGLNAPKIRELTEPAKSTPGSGPASIPHPIGARTDCTLCHGPQKVRPMPDNHASFKQDICTSCHKPTLQEKSEAAPAAPTATAAAAAPTKAVSALTPPAATAAAVATTAATAPVVAATAVATPPAAAVTPTTAAAAPAAGGPSAIPHDLAGRENCLTCHNPAGGIKPAPADHAGRTNEMCTACHKPKS